MSLQTTKLEHAQSLPDIMLAVVLVLFTSGCDTTDRTDGEASITGRDIGREITVDSNTPVVTGTAEVDANTLAPGTFEIRLHDGRFTILARDAPALDILNNLAILAGFKVVDTGTPLERVTLTIEGSDIHTALVELLKPHPYQIIYEYVALRGGDTLTRVVAGKLPAIPGIMPATGYLPGVDGSAPLPDAAEPELSVQDQVFLSQLLDPSPEVRAYAAESIEAAGIALDYLARILTTDPSPEVRMAAAFSLESSDDPRALETLVLGLNDADPAVLVEVIDSLGYLDDRHAVPYLQPFLDHPDEGVRDSAKLAIDSLL